MRCVSASMMSCVMRPPYASAARSASGPSPRGTPSTPGPGRLSTTSYAGCRASSSCTSTTPSSRATCAPMHTCTPWPKPRWRSITRWRVEPLRIGELVLVAVRADQEQHHALTGAHRDARDLGVDEQGAPDELQRQLVTQHLLERARDAVAGSATSAARCSGCAPELVGSRRRRSSAASPNRR